MSTMEETLETLQMRVHEGAGATLPTLVYLPGLHGDWTLVGGFRHALEGKVRFVEFTYPRTLSWSLENYAAAIEAALQEQGITEGWLLAESFGSQVVWPLIQRGRFRAQGLILAGGFVNHPLPWGVRLAERICGGVPLTLVAHLLSGYARIARWRFRHDPQLLVNIEEFVSRRTRLDQQAVAHRLRLIAKSDWSAAARIDSLPVYAMTGLFDPIVPWVFVRSWLKHNCPALRQYKVIWRADHNVLGTAPGPAATLALAWLDDRSTRGPGLPNG